MRSEPRYKKGDKIGNRYLVHKVLMGGMGEVYLCLDLEEMHPYALKTFQQRYLTDSHRLRKVFEQEVATWIALEKHPNIVRCFHTRTFDNQPFMVLEWIVGEEAHSTDLRSWLRHGPLDLKLALEIAIDICRGLLHAQAKQPPKKVFVHRDLKPENILMAQGGQAKITDFGLAQIIQMAGVALDNDGVTSDGRQSMIGGQGIAGTPAYMAPEQWRGETLDARTDIYALGCIVYELLTGRPPFSVALPSATPQNIQTWLRTFQNAHEQGQIPPLPGVLPAALNDLVQRCLAKPPIARYLNVSALLTDLTDLYQAYFHHSTSPWTTPDTFTATDYNNRGLTYADLQEYTAALADYAHAIELDPNYVIVYNNRGNTYAALQNYAAALVDYTQAITLAPEDAQLFYNRGNTYRTLQDNMAALTDYTQAITLDPYYAKAYNNCGLTYADLGQHEAALADYTRALKLDPNDAKAYNNRGLTYADLRDYASALADYTRALKLDPNEAKFYNSRSATYRALQKDTEALADFTRAIELDPNDATTYNNRGVTYGDLQEHVAALADFTHAIELDPTYTTAYYNRGITYQVLQNNIAALTDFTSVLKLDPKDVNAYVNRGLIYADLQQFEAALADYTHALEHAPNYATPYLNIGVLLYNQGRLVDALPYFEQAAQLGDPQATQYAAQINSTGEAFAAFFQADAILTMQQAGARFPLLLQAGFIATIEQVIAQFPPAERPALTQRLAWLRQIANTQHPRSTP